MNDFINSVFSRTTPEQFLGAFIVGIGFGYVARGMGRNPNGLLTMVLLAGFTYWTFVILYRVFDGIPNPEVSIGTALLFVPFALGLRVVMHPLAVPHGASLGEIVAEVLLLEKQTATLRAEPHSAGTAAMLAAADDRIADLYGTLRDRRRIAPPEGKK